MSMSLDRPPAVFQNPGPDTQPEDVDEAADKLIAVITADRNLDQREIRAVQRVMAAVQQVAEMKQAQQQAAMQEQGMGDGTEAFGAGEGTEDAGGPQDEGTEPFYG